MLLIKSYSSAWFGGTHASPSSKIVLPVHHRGLVNPSGIPCGTTHIGSFYLLDFSFNYMGQREDKLCSFHAHFFGRL